MAEILWNHLNLECIFRLVLAGTCGGIIGIERTKRSKGAGVRTHIIVAIGAALFVIVSKYGFLDAVAQEGAQVDVSRVASNVVVGVGFLGAGVIFTRGDSVQGLTTAAGIWVTAAIGLAVGAGMYIIGSYCTFLIMVVQFILHRGYIDRIENMVHSKIVISMQEEDPEAIQSIEQRLKEKNIIICGSHIKKQRGMSLTYTLDIQMPRSLGPCNLLAILQECDHVQSIGM